MLITRGIRRIRFRKKRLVFIFLIIFLSLFFLFDFQGKALSFAHSAVDKISEKTGLNIGKIFYDFESAINIFRPKKDLWTGELPIFQLKLSEKDTAHFNELSKKSVQQGYLDKEENTWRDVKLKYKDVVYDAKIKLHGDNPNHWNTVLKSYKVKMLGNDSINNLERFNFLIFEDRLLDAKIIKILSDEFGLFDIRDDLVVLKINGVPQGLYYLVESLDPTFLEHNMCSSCEVVKMKDNKWKDHPENKEGNNPNLDSFKPYGLDYLPGHVTPFDYELSHIDLEKSDLNLKKVLNSVNGLFKAIEDRHISQLVAYFDIDYITTFEAQRMISGSGQVSGDDLKMVYKATNSKFYPIPFEGGLEFIKIDRGGLERSLNMYSYENGEKAEIKLFALLNSNDVIRQLKYKKVYQYILDNRAVFLKKIDDLVEKYLPYANAHKGSAIGTKTIDDRLRGYGPLFKHNLDVIKDALEYATCYINVIEKENKVTLEIIPDSISQLKFNSFKINLLEGKSYSGNVVLEYKDENNNLLIKSVNIESPVNSIDLTDIVKDFYFSTGLDEDLGTKRRDYTIEISFQNTEKIFIDNIETKVKNDITGNLLENDEVYIQIADANDYYDSLVYVSLNDFIGMYEEFNWGYQDNALTLLKGDYNLKRDLIIPEGLIFNIESGVQILIDEDKSIVSHSPVNVMGTEIEPVVIKALDSEKPFGTFGVVGEGQKTTINWLRLSGGNEKFINGIYFSGGLSIHHMDVDMSNTIISDNHADDGLNIKYGKVLIDNSLFINNFADQIDLDFTQGIVKNSQFKENSLDADDNGDGLDLSGSKIIAKNNLFSGFRDKGISVGEETYVVMYDNMIKDNNLGAAVKDSSHAFFIENSFENNQIAVSAYQKKPIYPSGGYSYFYSNAYESNVESYKSDEKSQKQDLKLDNIYNQVIIDIIDENLDGLFQTLNSFIIQNGNK